MAGPGAQIPGMVLSWLVMFRTAPQVRPASVELISSLECAQCAGAGAALPGTCEQVAKKKCTVFVRLSHSAVPILMPSWPGYCDGRLSFKTRASGVHLRVVEQRTCSRHAHAANRGLVGRGQEADRSVQLCTHVMPSMVERTTIALSPTSLHSLSCVSQ